MSTTPSPKKPLRSRIGTVVRHVVRRSSTSNSVGSSSRASSPSPYDSESSSLKQLDMGVLAPPAATTGPVIPSPIAESPAVTEPPAPVEIVAVSSPEEQPSAPFETPIQPLNVPEIREIPPTPAPIQSSLEDSSWGVVSSEVDERSPGAEGVVEAEPQLEAIVQNESGNEMPLDVIVQDAAEPSVDQQTEPPHETLEDPSTQTSDTDQAQESDGTTNSSWVDAGESSVENHHPPLDPPTIDLKPEQEDVLEETTGPPVEPVEEPSDGPTRPETLIFASNDTGPSRDSGAYELDDFPIMPLELSELSQDCEETPKANPEVPHEQEQDYLSYDDKNIQIKVKESSASNKFEKSETHDDAGGSRNHNNSRPVKWCIDSVVVESVIGLACLLIFAVYELRR